MQLIICKVSFLSSKAYPDIRRAGLDNSRYTVTDMILALSSLVPGHSTRSTSKGDTMKHDQALVQQLNKVLTLELTSINQYFLHARIFKNWGLEKLNHKAYKKSILDMKQADKLIERILFLEGLPNLQHLERLRIGEDTEEMLKGDLSLEQDQISLLRESIALCEAGKDYVSRALLVEILEQEEEHLDWIETQQHLIGEIGIQNYLQSAIEED